VWQLGECTLDAICFSDVFPFHAVAWFDYLQGGSGLVKRMLRVGRCAMEVVSEARAAHYY
jgi:hypothetical protein